MLQKTSTMTLKDKIILSIAVLMCVFAIVIAKQLESALLPPIKRPEIAINVTWPGKGVEEIQQTLVSPLEEVLNGIPNSILMSTTVSASNASINLQFQASTDMQAAYLETLNRINQVPGWPSEVPAPTVTNFASGSSASLASMMLISNTSATHSDFIHAFENYLKPALSQINGVQHVVTSNNPTQQRVEIILQHDKIKRFGLSITQIQAQLNTLNDSSGDYMYLGDRRYALHFSGQKNFSELMSLPIAYHSPSLIKLSDIATVNQRTEREWLFSSIQGKRAFYMYFQSVPDVNVLATLVQTKEVISRLNQGPLAELDMELVLSRDDSKAIKSAISQVYLSLLLGIILSSLVLYLFIKQSRFVTLIFISIPVCLAAVVLLMYFLNFSLNVISLAGMALSIGLLLDASIVAVDSIEQKRRQGETLNQAIVSGISAVKGAVISSTLSSIVIFIPILLMQSPEAQLFKDLAFTISAALLTSLVSALCLLPIVAKTLLKNTPHQHQKPSGVSPAYHQIIRSKPIALSVLVILIPIACLIVWQLTPQTNLLPAAKNRAVHAYISFQDPLSPKATQAHIAEPILKRLAQQQSQGSAPQYDLSGLFCWEGFCLLYFYPPKDWHYDSFSRWLKNEIVHDLPGARVTVVQEELLRLVMPNAGVSYLDLQGAELSTLQSAGQQLLRHLQNKFDGAQIRAVSELSNSVARINFTPNHPALLRYNMNLNDLNLHLEALTQGVYLGRFNSQGQNLPFYLKIHTAEDLKTLLSREITIENVGLRPISELTEAEFSVAPARLNRINQRSVVTLSLAPPANISQSEFITAVKQETSDFLAKNQLSKVNTTWRGSADQLDEFIKEFSSMFLMSVLILCFLLRLSLRNWRQTAAVLLSMPLAMLGGMLCLRLLGLATHQPLDIITMIGFIILMGLVINNAILLINQYDFAMQRGATQSAAIVQAISIRKRPIFMSTGTSIFGMLPLMLLPGEGAEIYRGLAAVIVGGMTFSALFSMPLMAALLSRTWYQELSTPTQPLATSTS
ncbi:efflux RND transporter permease subunit [Pseudoalteromonas luteoviolacea]|uniref:efflux RND transporter permease subunit n=1 Tax=Pseudoalteromonas luteoviolacea TaxID=43657 RepID=UPI0011545617|nr:efflux RND transporter permease subunit [Pseudoalteromonas luteoviolacea]TQF66756.1 efflux RND transporter permease subunit [Pseudoalteromonas luteoviolacea]